MPLIMTRKKKKIVQGLLFLIGIAVVFSYVYIQKKTKENRLKREHAFAKGIITDIVIPGKTAKHIDYIYEIDGKNYKGFYYGFDRKNRDKYKAIVDSYFRVIYEPSCPSNSALLLRKEDYQEYGIPLDSMGNVIDFY